MALNHASLKLPICGWLLDVVLSTHVLLNGDLAKRMVPKFSTNFFRLPNDVADKEVVDFYGHLFVDEIMI